MEVKMPAAEMVDISLLKPYKKNTKKHNQTQIDNVAESIRKFGFVQPFVIDKNNEVVIGHCRLLAAQKLGIKELPCVRVDYLTAAQVFNSVFQNAGMSSLLKDWTFAEAMLSKDVKRCASKVFGRFAK